jgi:YD repeat-containing protein
VLALSTSPALSQAPDPEASPGGGLTATIDAKLKVRALEMVNELSNRRRLHLLFENPQSPGQGVQKSHVNVGAGNLTFIQRDLIHFDGIPLVAGRVYDSNLREATDFGPGWKFAMSERIRRQPGNTFVYIDANNGEYPLRFKGGALVPDQLGPPGILQGSHRAAQIILRDARFTRTFTVNRDQFLLTRVEDRSGIAVRLDYERGRLAALISTNGRSIAIERDSAGRIVAISDDAGRRIEYRYSASGTLQSSDLLSGEVLEYRYDAQQRLTTLIDPRDVAVLTARYANNGKISEVTSLGTAYRFTYEPGRTTVTDARNVSSVFEQNEAGRTVAVIDNTGVETRLVFEESLNGPVGFQVNGTSLASFAYTPSGALNQVRFTDADTARNTRLFYDALGRLAAIETDGEATALFDYDGRGRLVQAWTAEQGTSTLTWASNGQPHRIDFANAVIEIDSDAYGRITRFTRNENDSLSIAYDDQDRVAGIDGTPMGSVTYGYGSDRFRQTAQYHTDDVLAYQYDATGNLLGMAWDHADGTTGEDVYVVGKNNELRQILSSEQPDYDFTYDVLGRATRVQAAGREFAIEYDEQSRVTKTTIDGRVALETDYGATQLDLAHHVDASTFLTPADQVSGSGLIGSLDEIVWTRPSYSPYAAVTFDAQMNRFVLLAPEDRYPESFLFDGFARRQLPLSPVGYEGLIHSFDKPSNALFLPAELSSVNCYVCNVTIYAHTLKVDGDAPAIVVVDDVVVANSSASGSGCYNPGGGPPPNVIHSIEFYSGQAVNAAIPGQFSFAPTGPFYGLAGVFNSQGYMECACGVFGVSWVYTAVKACGGGVHIAE